MKHHPPHYHKEIRATYLYMENATQPYGCARMGKFRTQTQPYRFARVC